MKALDMPELNELEADMPYAIRTIPPMKSASEMALFIEFLSLSLSDSWSSTTRWALCPAPAFTPWNKCGRQGPAARIGK